MSTPRKARKTQRRRNTLPELSGQDLSDAPAPTSDARHDKDVFTLKHLIESFLAETRMMVCAGQTSEKTLDWYVSMLNHLAPLGGSPAEMLRTHHLAGIKFTNGFVRVLKRLYRWGAAEDLLPKDPFAKLTVPPCGRRERILTRPELRRLYLATSRAFRRLLFVQLRTIARPGEIRQLTWEQIDWANRVIVLVKFKGKKLRRDKLRARLIPLSLPVLRILKNLHRKSADPSPTGRVFIAHRGKPWTANGARCAMRSARVRAGLEDGGERIVFYSARHTGATLAIRAGIELKLVAEMMGHARTSTTERYVHLDTSDVVGAIDRMNARPKPKAG